MSSTTPWIIGVPATLACVLFYVLTRPDLFDREIHQIVNTIVGPFFRSLATLFGA